MVTKETTAVFDVLKNVLRFREHIFVIKLSGSVIDDAVKLAEILRDIDMLSALGVRQVIVHGAGNAINDAMKHADLIPQFIEGERVTPEPVMKIVFDVLMDMNDRIIAAAGKLDSQFIAPSELEEKGIVITAKRKDQRLGYVGTIDWIDVGYVRARLERGHIPVIPSLAYGPRGLPYNVNADDVACAIAVALRAEKLILISNVPGVTDGEQLLETVCERTSEELIEKGVISDGMIPKVRAIFRTIRGGVRNIHLIGSDSFHSLIMEIMTAKGVGTMFIP